LIHNLKRKNVFKSFDKSEKYLVSLYKLITNSNICTIRIHSSSYILITTWIFKI